MLVQPSFLKTSGIYILPCDTSASFLYPLNKNPELWRSCHDAYEYTWMEDPDKLLGGLSDMNKVKLARSMGYCPHMRCQLGNLTSTNSKGDCPPGLCYTKLENGGLSFGACCFKDGVFNSGKMIGYYNKTQVTAKPIYKKRRVVLVEPAEREEDSYDRFVNANSIHPGIIATQCPMKNTIHDILKMIIQYNVSLWIQLTPEKQISALFPHANISLDHSGSTKDCFLLSDALRNISFSDDLDSINYSFIFHGNRALKEKLGYFDDNVIEMDQISIIYSNLSCSTDSSLSNSTCSDNKSGVIRQLVQFMWYRHWDDFSVPRSTDDEIIKSIIQEGSNVLSSGGKVAINCLSGRGRTGTLAALLLGKHHRVTSHDELVNIIVQLREYRDGMVEIPLQYQYISNLLSLPQIGGLMNSAVVPTRSQVDTSIFRLICIFCMGCFCGVFSFFIIWILYFKKKS